MLILEKNFIKLKFIEIWMHYEFVQRQCEVFGASLILQETYCLFTSMNVRKMKLPFYFDECQKNEIYFLTAN